MYRSIRRSLLLLIAGTTAAFADPPPPNAPPPPYPPPATVVAIDPSPVVQPSPTVGAPLPVPVDPVETLANERARFSGKRLALEILGGGLIGGVTSALVFGASCDGHDCLGASLLSFGADFAVTPLAVYGIGNLMGGRGSLLYSYLGAGPALTPFSMTGPADETPDQTLSRLKLEVTLSTIFLPICSAVLYEATSHFSYVRWQREHGASIALTPVHGSGAMGVVSLSF
jgi:hypothetical protein